MKSSLLALVCTASIWVLDVSAQIRISQFSFEVVTPPDSGGQTVGPFNADFGPGTISAFHSAMGTNFTTPIGNGSANAFGASNWSIGDYFQFSISTVGFSNLFLTFATERSGTGPTTFQLVYSTDGGMNFSLAGSPFALSSAAFSSSTYNASFVSTYDLTAIAALNNNANVVIRLVATVAGTGSAGTARVDDFILSSGGPITVPEPAARDLLIGAGVLGALLVARRSRRRG
jgi:hypothetical protein